jgi:hypothetical protein
MHLVSVAWDDALALEVEHGLESARPDLAGLWVRAELRRWQTQHVLLKHLWLALILRKHWMMTTKG